MVLCFLLSAVFSYLLGSLNFAIIVSHCVKNDDIRNHGSQNAGLTNMIRTYGTNEAVLTFVGDMAKGIAAVWASKALFDLAGFSEYSDIAMFVSMFFTMAGHVFPVFFRFKGGKGVLTSAACLLAIDWRVFVTVILVFIVILAISRYVSLASIVATATAVVAVPFYDRLDGGHMTLIKTAIIAVIAAAIIIKHRSNIVRLKNGTENRFGKSKKD